MPNMKQICLALVLVCALFSTAAAQDSTTAKITLTITANATGERVRITAPSSVVQLRVEVYAAGGEKLFDQEIRGGNVFDWHLQDGQAQRLAPGAYVCVVTAKSVSGKITQKLGTVTVAEKSASVQAGSLQLSLQQTQAIGPVEADSSWTIAGENEPQTPTVIANDGTDGQMIRGRGALTFRIGNFFSGIDTEQMRLTEAGDLGIGTSTPQSKLEVAGAIRAERFLVVKPKVAGGDKTTAGTAATESIDSVQPLIAGTGTQNQIARWTDNAGTLGDSGITENGGNVGIGTLAPGAKLEVNGNIYVPNTGGFLANNGQSGMVVRTSGNLDLYNGNAVRATLDTTGNLGIGTLAPGAKLEVNGNIYVPNTGGFLANNGQSGMVVRTSGNLDLYNGNAIRATLDTAGNLGIGTTSPGSKLTVVNAFQSVLAVSNSGTAGTGMTVQRDGANSYLWSYGAVPLLFATNGAEKMRITSSGNVGIGTTAPGARLHVNGGDIIVTPVANNGMQFGSPNGETGMSITTNTGRADLRHDGLTLKLVTGPPNAGPPSGTNGIVIDAAGKVGIGTSPSADARLRALGGPNSGVHGDSINSNGVSGTSAEGVGVRGFSINNVGVFGRSTNSFAGYFAGNVSVEGNVCAANIPCFSDARLKQHVTNLKYGVRHLLQLRPVSWQWKDPKQRQPALGLVAQEVEPVMPELVLHGTDVKDSLGLNYLGLIPVLVKGIQEQQEQIDALQRANDALNARLRLIARTLKNKRGSTRQRR